MTLYEKRVGIRLSNYLDDKITLMAHKADKTKSEYIRELIREEVKKMESE